MLVLSNILPALEQSGCLYMSRVRNSLWYVVIVLIMLAGVACLSIPQAFAAENNTSGESQMISLDDGTASGAVEVVYEVVGTTDIHFVDISDSQEAIEGDPAIEIHAIADASDEYKPISYQWYVSVDGGATYTKIEGATSDTYSVPTDTAGNYLYKCVASDAFDFETQTVIPVTINAKSSPLPTSNLAFKSVTSSQTAIVSENGGVSLTAVADCSEEFKPITYQWYVSTDGGKTYKLIEGATDSTYVAPTNKVGDYLYKCVATDKTGYSVFTVIPVNVKEAEASPTTPAGENGSTTAKNKATSSSASEMGKTGQGLEAPLMFMSGLCLLLIGIIAYGVDRERRYRCNNK